MGKNKEEFMKDREKEALLNDFHCLIDNVNDKMNCMNDLEEDLEEAKHLLSKCKTLIADMVLANLNKDMYSRYDDVMKQSQELLQEIKDY